MSILSVIFSYVCLIYAEIFEKMSSGGLEVSFSMHRDRTRDYWAKLCNLNL